MDRFEYQSEYRVYNAIYTGYQKPPIYYNLVNIDQTVVHHYYNIGYGVLKEFRLENKFSLLPSAIIFCQFYKTYRSINQFYNFSKQIPDEDLIKETKKKYHDAGRIGLNLTLNGKYQLSKKVSILVGLSVLSTKQDSSEPDDDEYSFFRKDLLKLSEYYYLGLSRELTNEIGIRWRLFTSINLGLNYTIRQNRIERSFKNLH